MDNNFQSVFECHPGVDEIFVVDGMPFLEPSHAQAHSITTSKPVQAIKRPKPAAEEKSAKEVKAPVEPKGKAPVEPKADNPEVPAGDVIPAAPAPKKGRGKKA